MGAKDNLQHGVYFDSTDVINEEIARLDNDTSHEDTIGINPARTFDDDDEMREFEAREEFAGRREGFIFRLGSKGLGYYGTSNNDKIHTICLYLETHIILYLLVFLVDQRISNGLYLKNL